MFAIDDNSAVPPFEQLRTQFVEAISAGSLPAGERLPAVRTLATELGLAAGTVARTYKELEAGGFVETRGRNGTIVSPHANSRRQQAQRAAETYAEKVRALEMPAAEALEFVRLALHT